MITFKVSDVVMGRLQPVCERDQALRSLLSARVEAMSPSARRLISCKDSNALAQAAHDAFYEHLPLVLSPDVVWLCLAQGFARHVNLNVERLRERFVSHQGKLKLVIWHPGIEFGRPSPWDETFTMFSDQIAAHIGKTRDLVVADFSTTGPVERAASEIVLMDAFQGYFEYELRFGCGIPEITLLGTPDDWRSIRRRAQHFSEYGLEAWTAVLLPVLDRLVETAEGRVDVDFWRSFFRYESGSGPSELTGWILTLFPYLDKLSFADDDHDGLRSLADPLPRLHRKTVWNEYLASWQSRHRAATARGSKRWWNPEGPALPEIPTGMSGAPVKVIDVRTEAETPMRFVAGLFGVTQDERTRALEPEFGWAIVYEPTP